MFERGADDDKGISQAKDDMTAILVGKHGTREDYPVPHSRCHLSSRFGLTRSETARKADWDGAGQLT